MDQANKIAVQQSQAELLQFKLTKVDTLGIDDLRKELKAAYKQLDDQQTQLDRERRRRKLALGVLTDKHVQPDQG